MHANLWQKAISLADAREPLAEGALLLLRLALVALLTHLLLPAQPARVRVRVRVMARARARVRVRVRVRFSVWERKRARFSLRDRLVLALVLGFRWGLVLGLELGLALVLVLALVLGLVHLRASSSASTSLKPPAAPARVVPLSLPLTEERPERDELHRLHV